MDADAPRPAAEPVSRGVRLALTAAFAAAALVPVGATARQSGSATADQAGIFVDGTEAAAIDFRHVSGAFGEKWMPEVNGAGVTFFDADGDGWTDVLFPQGMVWEGHEEGFTEAERTATMKLFRNRGDGTFEDATARAGLEIRTYGFAAMPADYDGDGDPDLYLTAYGPNRLLRNDGGVFVDVTEEAGVGHDGWGGAAAWLDFDHDGDLDLFAANYLQWEPSANLYCTIDGETRSYCNPEAYTGEPSVLYRNEGDGTFIDVTRAAGVFVPGGKTLGLTILDLDDDGWLDIATANDTEPNFLFRNQRDGTFEEVGMLAGTAVDASGLARSGMGIDAADVANDGRSSIAIGNFSSETIALFEQISGDVFVDVAPRSELGRTSFLPLTFALFFFDYDLDGALDLLAINGHVFEQIGLIEPNVTYEEPALLYRNRGGGDFVEVSERVGGPLVVDRVGRGAAYADIDRDGDLDVAVTEKDGPASLWINRVRDRDPAPHLLRVRLVGNAPNTDALGAIVTAVAGDWRQRQMVRSGSSYLSQNELTLTFGLGSRESVDALEIRWPLGATTVLDAETLAGAVDHELVIHETTGITARIPLTGRDREQQASRPSARSRFP